MALLGISLEDIDNLTDVIEKALNTNDGKNMPLKEYHTHKVIIPIKINDDENCYEISVELPCDNKKEIKKEVE